MSTADKLLSALSLFTPEAPQWTVEAAAHVLQISSSTAYRYFNSLTKAGLLDPATPGRYVLGPAIIAFDRQLRLQDPLLQVARPVLASLVQNDGGKSVALLCRRFRQQVMCVHQEFSHAPAYAVSYERGRPMGLFRGAASLAILAHLPTRNLRALWRNKSAEIAQTELGATWPEFLSSLREIRAAGVWWTKGQLDPGMVGIASPIRDLTGAVSGSVSIVLPARLTCEDEIERISRLVSSAASKIDRAVQNAAAA